MSTSEKPGSQWAISRGSGQILSRLRQWWRRPHELATGDRCELKRLASDRGMPGGELEEPAARGQHTSGEVRLRMHQLGITSGDVGRVARGLMRDLERECTRCNHKRACAEDLAIDPYGSSWRDYCPNAVALTAIRHAQHHFPTP